MIGLLITSRNMAFFLISSMASGLLDQLQIYWQLYLIELLGLFNRSEVTLAVAHDISKAFDRVWYAGLLHKLKSYGNSSQVFGLSSFFLSNRQLRVVLDGNVCKNIQFMLVFLKLKILHQFRTFFSSSKAFLFTSRRRNNFPISIQFIAAPLLINLKLFF